MDKKKLSSIVPGYNALRRVYLNFKYAHVYKLIKRLKRKNEKLTMVFLLNRTSIWNSLKPMYDAALADSDIKTYLVALPPYIKDKIDVDNNSSYEFCKKIGGNVINGYNAQTMEYVNLDKLNPDYIMIGIPYMSEYPECYSFDKLSKLAHICYFSYGYTMKKSKMQEITVQDPIMQFVSYIFACNDIMYGYYIKRMYLSERINGQRLYNIGFPRFDLYRNLKNNDSSNKTIMWLPRWTTASDVNEDGNEPSSFFELKDNIVDFMDRHKENKLIARPHPLAFENYVKHGMMTEDEVNEYKYKLSCRENILLDTEPSYYDNLIKSDILITDFTSILAEYFVTGRPVIYMGNPTAYPKENKLIYESFYYASNWEEAEKILTKLCNGIDIKKEQREKAVAEFMKNIPENIGEHIKNLLVADYEKRRESE